MLRDDIEAAVRALRARPAFATLIVCCLAIGIGANIAMFSIANVLFLRPPTGVRNVDALMRLDVVRRSGETQSPQGGPFSYPDFAAKPVAIGLVAELAGAIGVTRFLQSLLYNVSPTDGPSFAAAAALLGLVAAVACIVPARKAAQVDPVVALRAE